LLFQSKHENVPPVTRMNIRDRLGVPSNKVLNLIQQKAKSENDARPQTNDKADSNRLVYVPTAKKPDPALQENSKALVSETYIQLKFHLLGN